MSTTGTALAPGVIIADTYQVERLLGRGGMGEVWAAKHLRLPGRMVAIKVLHTLGGLLGAEALSRFRREAEIAARLAHPNIVPVLDFNTLPTGQPYLVMELLQGESLANRLLRGPLSVAEVIGLIRQVGSALRAAHAQGVVHRDLKPDNLFLTRTEMGDQVKLLDFGISKLADSQTVQTTESVLLGTPLYMSPEQAVGNNRDVSAKSDIFSLASICYEALTGRPAFEADNVAKVVFRIAYEPHQPIIEVRPDTPPSLAQAIERALVKKREERTATIETFVAEASGGALSSLETPSTSTSGVLPEGMRVSDSIAMAATRAPSNLKATPAPAPVPTAAVSGARRTLVAMLIVALLAVGAGVGVLLRQRAHGVAATGVDAGPPVVLAQVKPLVERDADVAEAVVDAGAEVVAVVDAGVEVSTPVVVRESPPSAADKAIVARVRALATAKKWGEVLDSFQGAQTQVSSEGGRRELLLLALEAACRRHDPSSTAMLNRLESRHGRGAAKKGKDLCRKAWPERDF